MSRRTQDHRRIAILAGGAVIVGSLFGFAGCEADPYRPQTDSILDILRGPSPRLAGEMAADPYDADRRYRGTLLLAGATFAGEEIYMNLFREYTVDEDSAVRAAAARAVANHGTAEDATYLIPLLDDDDVLVRREAARGLQRLHNVAAVAPLIRKLSFAPQRDTGIVPEDDTQVRAQAALALGQYGSSTVVDALVASLDDPQLAVNRGSLSSLRTLTGQDLGYSRTDWTLWMRAQSTPLLGQAVFIYPGYVRRLKWYEKIPFVPRPQMEPPGIPVGFPVPGSM